MSFLKHATNFRILHKIELNDVTVYILHATKVKGTLGSYLENYICLVSAAWLHL